MGYEIGATYEDDGRPMAAQIKATAETIVVYDDSRWGRFQNIDGSAGVRIELCVERFMNNGSVGSDTAPVRSGRSARPPD
ncbi:MULTISPECIES: hypothetical protein [unclassified Mesorhizobium]|uniref:hypothetical protein n=1 Tax=unclassified Mesorhizobium TaxID=325217 RepID=UPI0015CEBF75